MSASTTSAVYRAIASAEQVMQGIDDDERKVIREAMVKTVKERRDPVEPFNPRRRVELPPYLWFRCRWNGDEIRVMSLEFDGLTGYVSMSGRVLTQEGATHQRRKPVSFHRTVDQLPPLVLEFVVIEGLT